MAVVLIAVAAALVTTVSAADATATASKTKPFSGNLCSLVSAGQLEAVHITAPCIKATTNRKVSHTPLGPVKITRYYAHWGLGSPHYLSLQVLKAQASPPALAIARKSYKETVLENGLLFSTNPLASDFLDTEACMNPPTEDCTTGKIVELRGNYSAQMFLHDTAPFVKPDVPSEPAVDEANDREQEEQLKERFDAIGRSVGARL